MNAEPTALDETHDPKLKSWVESANRADADFPIQNLPFAVFRRRGSAEDFRGAVAIGDQVLDLGALQAMGLVKGSAGDALAAAAGRELNAFMAQGHAAASALRGRLSELLRSGAASAAALQAALVPQQAAEYALPAQIGDFTDFYASIHHATAVGRLFRPDNPLLPNYRWVPIAYHGRASSIRVSGQDVLRPRGQTLAPGAERPQFAPCRRLDYEFEVGAFIGTGNPLGRPIPIARAEEHLFGLCLLNDWSARDIQAWEYQPLGPFLSKNFATTISPWVITLEALAPFRLPWTRAAPEPQPLPYLDSEAQRKAGAFDIRLDAFLQTAAMRAAGGAPFHLSRSNFRHSYWTFAQMVAHHTASGCNLQPGDLFGSGTQSGPEPSEAGSLLELTCGGKRPLTIDGAEVRTFLEDGDCVTLSAACERSGRVRIGFGEASGTVIPARAG